METKDTFCELFMTKRSLEKNATETNDHFASILEKIKCPQIIGNQSETKDKSGKDNLIILAEFDSIVSHLIDK
jgi:hypothetical protein